ncbi:telomeric repeat binding factor a [Micropterus salmoides]|uniref:telomeric repeat binding factor a n=1 Tax=Micropterus salmoides TaxID=27706 RepID=UPI0018EAA307|nr:telomeric repeat binding factor a [Micropterus salmoides]
MVTVVAPEAGRKRCLKSKTQRTQALVFCSFVVARRCLYREVMMAARDILQTEQIDYEPVVNRWLIDYYFFLAQEMFQKDQYADFCGLRDILGCVIDRPVERTDTMETKILVLKFLCWIHEGERPGAFCDSDTSVSPLESALILLERMNQKCSIPPQYFKNVCTSLREMIVGIFIKNKDFDRAKAVLNKHFPKQMVGKKAIFRALISQKSNAHEVIEQIDFKRFKEEMLTFCQTLCPVSVPFLHKAAKQLADERLANPDKAAVPDDQDKPGPSCSTQPNGVQFVLSKHTIIQKTSLEAAYTVLASGSDERTFAQLEEEVEEEKQARREDLSLRLSPTPEKGTKRDSEQDGLFQRDSGSPLEASPADQPQQTDAVSQTQAGSLSKTPPVRGNRRLYTVARLVVEPDSQGSSQCTTASQELEAEVRREEPLQVQTTPNNPVTENEVTPPTWKRSRQATKICARASTSLAELSADSEESSGSVASGETCVGKSHNQSNGSLSRTPDNTGDIHILDSSHSSPELSDPVPQTSSTPHKDSAQDKGPSHSKWKQLYNNAKESKDTWSDEESYFTTRKKSSNTSNVSGLHNQSTISNSGHRKRKWSESETQKLREGVKKFGEGNWSKIKAYYSFTDRTNVNLKDRWRTMKKSNMT